MKVWYMRKKGDIVLYYYIHQEIVQVEYKYIFEITIYSQR